MESWLLHQWYESATPAWWLRPPGFLFRVLVVIRHCLYQAGILQAKRLPIPVVVVGNLTVGGTGKTPLTLALVEELRRRGWTPGILSRGYGAQAREVRAVTAGSPPADVGDEPALMASLSDCPVWVGRNRFDAGRALLQAHPGVNVLVCDDGLQHLALARDMEIVVVDGERFWGNGHLLPAGPLREPLSRLSTVDAVVVQGRVTERESLLPREIPCYSMTLEGQCWSGMEPSDRHYPLDHFTGQSCHAVAGIGNPQRFFRYLGTLGIDVRPHPFPDHHPFKQEDLCFEPELPILTTEKDGIKCRNFAPQSSFMLSVKAVPEAGFFEKVQEVLTRRVHGRTSA